LHLLWLLALGILKPSHPLNETLKKLLIVWFMESDTLGTFSKIFVVGYSLAFFKLYLRQFWSEYWPDVFIGVINIGVLYYVQKTKESSS
jgi:L-lactate permease